MQHPIKLEPCPFCGGEAVMNSTGGNDERTGYCKTWIVTCLTCPAKVSATDLSDANGWSKAKQGETEGRAIAYWNRRVQSAPHATRHETAPDVPMREETPEGGKGE